MKKRAAFTLLELMVVLVLLAITAVAAVPAFLPDSRATPEKALASEVSALLTHTRETARRTGATASLVLSPDGGRYWMTQRDSSLAGTISIGALRLSSPSRDRVECRFSASGGASPCIIEVEGTARISIRVDEWTGEIVTQVHE